MKKRIMAFCLAIVLCLAGINDSVISKAEVDSTSKNVALASNGTSIFIDKPHAWAEGAGYGIGRMIDGAYNEPGFGFTNGNQNAEINLTLEFQRTYQVDSIVLYGHQDGGFPEDFTVSAYTKEGWQEVVNETGYTSKGEQDTFTLATPVDCAGIRLTITKNGNTINAGYQFYLKEFEVYGVESNVAISKNFTIKNAAAAANGAQISSDKTTGEGHEIGKLIDGNTAGNDFANINADNAQEVVDTNITVSFEGCWHIDTVRLYKSDSYAFPADFTIDVLSRDGWKTVRSETGYRANEKLNSFSFEGVDCTAVRLHVTKQGKDESGGWNEYTFYLSELEAWGTVTSIKNAAAAANGATISSDKTTGEGHEIDKLINGNTAGNDFANINADNGKDVVDTNITVDFKGNWHIDTVRLYRANSYAFPADFTIDVLTRGEWKTVHSEAGYRASEGLNSFSFEGIDCTAVRLHVTKQGKDESGGWDEYTFYLSELEAWGTKEAGLAGNTATLDGTIGFNYYMNLSEELAARTDVTMKFAYGKDNENVQEVPINAARYDMAKDAYLFTCKLPAKHMADEVTAQLFAGEEAKSEVYKLSVKSYGEAILNDEISIDGTGEQQTAVKTLVRNMLHYGAAAQKYFKYHPDNLADAGVSDGFNLEAVTGVDQTSFSDAYNNSKLTADGIGKIVGSNLYLKGETDLKVYIELADGVLADSLTFTCDGKELTKGTYKLSGKDLVTVTIPNIAAHELQNMWEIKIANADNSIEGTLSYSVFTYAYNALADSYTPDTTNYGMSIKDLMKVMYKYNKAAIDVKTPAAEQN